MGNEKHRGVGKVMKPPMKTVYANDFQTPPIALKPLLPYLKRDWLVWECAEGKGNLTKTLIEEGYDVIGGTGGYPMVHLCDGRGKVKSVKVHSLVAEYFIGEKPKFTYLENENDKIGNGTWNTRNGGAKLTPLQVQEIRAKLKNTSQKELAKEYNVSRPTITRIANNKIWRTI